MTTHGDRLKAKIAALRAKTQGNGCTEAEALAAADAVARLMREHDLTEADLVMVEARATDDTKRSTWRTTLSAYIGHATNTSVMILKGRSGSELVFVGRDPSPEIAVYLRDVCVRAVGTELKAFKEGSFYRRRRTLRTKRQAALDFVDALVIRLGCRLIDLFGSTIEEQASLEARRARDALFPSSEEVRLPSRESRFDEARAEGWRAGGRVPLNHGVDASAPLQLPHTPGAT